MGDKDLTINIETSQGTWENTPFEKTAKVSEVMTSVVAKFKFASNGRYELTLATDANNPLKPERPLVSYGIKDGDVLVFTDLGVAV